MSKLKVGDLVWVSDTVSDIPDQSYAAGCIMTQMDGQNEVMVSEEAWMPDVPNLAAVARVIAAHGEALKWAVEFVVSEMDRKDFLVKMADEETKQVMRLFRAALNGNGE